VETRCSRASAGQTDEIARLIEPGHSAEAAPGQLEAVATLPAAKIEHAVARSQAGGSNDRIHFSARIPLVSDWRSDRDTARAPAA